MSNPAPGGYTTVAPWIVTRDTGKLLDFITSVFAGEELGRIPLDDGSIGHAEIRVGDTILLAFDQRQGWPETPSMLRVFVSDADTAMERAVGAGGRVVTRPSTHAFGQRTGRVRDPFGNIWWISAVVEVVAPEEACDALLSPPTPRQCAMHRRRSTANSAAATAVSRAVRSRRKGRSPFA